MAGVVTPTELKERSEKPTWGLHNGCLWEAQPDVVRCIEAKNSKCKQKEIEFDELSEANRHCIVEKCEGCPYENQPEKCKNREKQNIESFECLVGMIF